MIMRAKTTTEDSKQECFHPVIWPDPEWEEASGACEKEQWYWCEMPNGGHTYHRYKPSVARLLSERDGMTRVMEHA